jgi:hypothetical protein
MLDALEHWTDEFLRFPADYSRNTTHFISVVGWKRSVTDLR